MIELYLFTGFMYFFLMSSYDLDTIHRNMSTGPVVAAVSIIIVAVLVIFAWPLVLIYDIFKRN